MSLIKNIAGMWKKIVKEPSMDSLVKKPDLLSYHIASKIPVSESTRQELLEIDGVSYRLRRGIELLGSFDSVRCKTCQVNTGCYHDVLYVIYLCAMSNYFLISCSLLFSCRK